MNLQLSTLNLQRWTLNHKAYMHLFDLWLNQMMNIKMSLIWYKLGKYIGIIRCTGKYFDIKYDLRNSRSRLLQNRKKRATYDKTVKQPTFFLYYWNNKRNLTQHTFNIHHKRKQENLVTLKERRNRNEVESCI